MRHSIGGNKYHVWNIKASSTIRLDARGQRRRLYEAGTANRLNVEHWTSNIEHRILMTLRFIDFKTSESQKTELQNFEGWFRFAQSFFKIDRIHHFDIRHSWFDIRYSLFRSFFSDQTGRSRPEAALVWNFMKFNVDFMSFIKKGYVRELASLAPWPTQWWECRSQSLTNMRR